MVLILGVGVTRIRLLFNEAEELSDGEVRSRLAKHRSSLLELLLDSIGSKSCSEAS